MKFGIIGCGHMAGIIMERIIDNGIVAKEDLIVSAKHERSRNKLKETYGVRVTSENADIAKEADVILIGLKPQEYNNVLGKISEDFREDQLIISLAVGITMDTICKIIGKNMKIVRAMPNVAAQVSEGVTGYCANEFATEEDIAFAKNIFESYGRAIRVHEEDMEIVSSIGSAAPAFIYILIEALADGAVAEGLKRDLAYQFASQMVLGTGKLVRDSNMHPAELKDMVCSPGGTTIEGVSLLEEKGFRSATIQAIRACVEKSRILAEKTAQL